MFVLRLLLAGTRSSRSRAAGGTAGPVSGAAHCTGAVPNGSVAVARSFDRLLEMDSRLTILFTVIVYYLLGLRTNDLKGT